MLIVVKPRIFISIWLCELIVALCLHLFQALCVSSADEVCLHVIDASLRIHQVLLVFALDLDHPHNYAINHIHRLTFFFFAANCLLVP
jgi:hypothetical protein